MSSTLKESINYSEVFGMKVYFPDYDQILDFIKGRIKKQIKTNITYCNAHTIRKINSDKNLKYILLKSSFIHADGTGIYWAAKFLDGRGVQKFNWTDCAIKFLTDCEKNEWKIFFLGATTEVLTRMLDNLKIRYPNLLVAGTLNGYDDINDRTAEKINEMKSDILWVGMGTPKQEKWIAENYDQINCTIIQSVGGIYDFIEGKRLRGPEFLRNAGLEWFIRVIQYPAKYFDRYILGIPIFFYLVLKEKVRLIFNNL